MLILELCLTTRDQVWNAQDKYFWKFKNIWQMQYIGFKIQDKIVFNRFTVMVTKYFYSMLILFLVADPSLELE